MSELKTFHSDPKIKEKYPARLKEHHKFDETVAGGGGKGGDVGGRGGGDDGRSDDYSMGNNSDMGSILMTTEKRIVRLERLMGHLRAKVLTIYNRHYAMLVRRSEKEKKSTRLMNIRLMNWEKRVSKDRAIIIRLAHILKHERRNDSLVYLNNTEFTKFRRWLKMDFRK